MALPEQVGSWINPIQSNFGITLPKLPSFLQGTIDTINGVVDLLISILDIALTALDIVRAFVVGFIDPITALIEAVVTEIEGLLRDFRKAGLYLNGDWNLVVPPFSDLLGGYSAYERRMIARFVDKTDPTRPQISSATPVMAMFLYSSVDFANFHQLARFLSLLVKFFRFDISASKTTSTPSDLRVEYGHQSTFFKFAVNSAERITTETQPLDIANVSWTLSSPVLKTPTIPFPVPPPHGFLIQVSTVRDGLPVYFDRSVANSLRVEGPGGEIVQDREFGRVLDPEGNPLTLHAGADLFLPDNSLRYNNAMDSQEIVKDGASRIFVRKTPSDNVPVPVESLKLSDGRHLLQKSFFLPTADVFDSGVASPDFFQRARYDLSLLFVDLPFDAEFVVLGDGTVQVVEGSVVQPQTYFVRVSVVSEAINRPDPLFYRIGTTDIDVPAQFPRVRYGFFDDPEQGNTQFSKGDLGEASAPLELNFPSANTRPFLDLVTRALTVLVLSRSDLEAGGDTEDFVAGKSRQATGLEEFAPLVAEVVNSANPNEFFSLADQNAEVSDLLEFRDALLEGCRTVASRLYRSLGAVPALEEAVLALGRPLADFTWDVSELFAFVSSGEDATKTSFLDFGLLEALESNEVDFGLARNPMAAGFGLESPCMPRDFGDRADVAVSDRLPGFYEREVDGLSCGSVDLSPVFVSERLSGAVRISYVRNMFSPDVYAAARSVLNAASAPRLRPSGDGSWISFRLGQLLPPLDSVFDTILSWARSISSGSQSIVDALVEYIDFLESRILELQALLNRIRAVLDSLIVIQLPVFASLFVLGSGTDDILARFVNAPNKPVDGTTTYGGGAVMLLSAPGVTDFMLDLFLDFLSDEGLIESEGIIDIL